MSEPSPTLQAERTAIRQEVEAMRRDPDDYLPVEYDYVSGWNAAIEAVSRMVHARTTTPPPQQPHSEQ